MNPGIINKTDLILKNAQPSIRDELSRHLASCGFTDPDDPTLNALVAQAMIAGQPVRLVETGGAAVATEASMARLGDRFESTAWSLARLRVGTILFACLLSFGIGAGGVAVAFKIWGTSLAGWFDLPRATDARLGMLDEVGAVLQVKRQKGMTYVYFDGQMQPAAGQTRDGTNFLYFKP